MAETIPSDFPGADHDHSHSRRKFLGLSLKAIIALGAPVGAFEGSKELFELYEDHKARNYTASLFENDGLYNWHKLTIVPLLLQIDPSAKVAPGMFKSPSLKLNCPPGGFVAVVRPIAVKPTLLRNVADYPAGARSEIYRALPSISPGLLAFYEPGPGNMVYFDADAYDGQVTPLTQNPIVGSHLGIEDLNITGREIRGPVVYPYTSSSRVVYQTNIATGEAANPQPVEDYAFIAQSITLTSADDLNAIASNYFYGQEPIGFPKP